jgi:glycosyltransferase involved in cell wall biosynthesis
MMALVRAYRTPIIHVHHGYSVHDVEGAVRRTPARLIVSFHGQDVIGMRRQFGLDVFRSVLARADAVIVPSRFFEPYAVDAGADPDKVHAIPAGVNLTWFAPTPLPSGPPEVLFAGRFVEKKGIDILLRAWPEVKRNVPEARLRMLGHGPLEGLARTGSPDVIVELTDPASRAHQVRDAIREARVVVTPSRTASDGDVESLLLVNLEAQASGRPLVTTRNGAIPEFVSDETAVMVPEGDASALAQGLTDVLLDDARATRMAAAGPEWVKRFDVRSCTAAVDDLYDRVAAR